MRKCKWWQHEPQIVCIVIWHYLATLFYAAQKRNADWSKIENGDGLGTPCMDLLFCWSVWNCAHHFFVLRHNRARLIVQSHENHFQLQERKFKSSSASMSNESKMRNNCFVIPVTVSTKRSPPCIAAWEISKHSHKKEISISCILQTCQLIGFNLSLRSCKRKKQAHILQKGFYQNIKKEAFLSFTMIHMMYLTIQTKLFHEQRKRKTVFLKTTFHAGSIGKLKVKVVCFQTLTRKVHTWRPYSKLFSKLIPQKIANEAQY